MTVCVCVRIVFAGEQCGGCVDHRHHVAGSDDDHANDDDDDDDECDRDDGVDRRRPEHADLFDLRGRRAPTGVVQGSCFALVRVWSVVRSLATCGFVPLCGFCIFLDRDPHAFVDAAQCHQCQLFYCDECLALAHPERGLLKQVINDIGVLSTIEFVRSFLACIATGGRRSAAAATRRNMFCPCPVALGVPDVHRANHHVNRPPRPRSTCPTKHRRFRSHYRRLVGGDNRVCVWLTCSCVRSFKLPHRRRR
jgi:hypothetical protein